MSPGIMPHPLRIPSVAAARWLYLGWPLHKLVCFDYSRDPIPSSRSHRAPAEATSHAPALISARGASAASMAHTLSRTLSTASTLTLTMLRLIAISPEPFSVFRTATLSHESGGMTNRCSAASLSRKAAFLQRRHEIIYDAQPQ